MCPPVLTTDTIQLPYPPSLPLSTTSAGLNCTTACMILPNSNKATREILIVAKAARKVVVSDVQKSTVK